MNPEPPPQIVALAPLLGTWRGTGRGHYPTITSFEYDEELRFWHVGKPWLGYEQRTWIEGAPSHSETGFWRVGADGEIEMVIAHAFGTVEVQHGRVTGNRIEVRDSTLASTVTAKRIEAVARVFEFDGDRLTYAVEMALGEHELQSHLEASLQRTS